MLLKPGKTISLDLSTLLLIISFLLISFGQLQRIQLSHQVAFYAHDFFISLFVSITFLTDRKKVIRLIKTAWNKNQHWRWLAIFLAWSIFGLIFQQVLTGLDYLPWLYLIRLLVYLSAGLGCYHLKKKSKQQHQWLAFIFVTLTSIVLAIGLFQYLLIPDLRFLVDQGWDVHYFRLAGVMLDPNFTGMILVITLLVWIVVLARSEIWRLSIGILLVIALLLTYSRSSYLVFVLTFLFAFLCQYRRRTQLAKKIKKSLIVLLTFFLILIPFLPRPGGLGVKLERTETVSSRAKVNQQILANIQPADLVIGKGLFVSTVNIEKTDQIVHANFPDNILIFILSSTGVVGLLIFCYWLWQLLSKLYQKNLLHFLLLAGVLIHAMFNLTLLEPITLLTLLLAFNI